MIRFEEIVGQDRALSLLKEAPQRDRLPHAYLFVGPEGVGRETTARALFGLLLCETQKACGSCLSCQKFQKGIHPDVEILFPAGKSIRIEQIRKVEAKIHFKPLEAPRRLILIPKAEALTREAANALLKSLEEPPPYNLFVLIAESTEALLPTIVSRCQLVRFRPLSAASLSKLLQERFEMLPEEAQGLASLAQGSIGRALRLAERGFLAELERLVAALRDGSPSRLVVAAEALAKLKEELPFFLELVLIWLQQSLYQELGLGKIPQSLPEAFPKEIILPAMEKIQALFFGLERNLNPEILLLDFMSEVSERWQEFLAHSMALRV